MKFVFTIAILFFVFVGKTQNGLTGLVSYRVDQVPDNYGGKNELQRLIDEQLIYPEVDFKNKTEGIVQINFICDEKGIIKEFKVGKGVNERLDNEAIRLFKLLLWHPAIKEGKAIAFEYFVEIPFGISKYKKALKRRNKLITNVDNLTNDTSFTIYQKVDKIATYLFGKDSLQNYIANELIYPQEAKAKNIEGVVELSFIVETNGTLTNINVEKNLGGGCQEEAIRVMSETVWIPAQRNKMNVRSVLHYSVVFKLNSNFKDNSQGSQRVGGY